MLRIRPTALASWVKRLVRIRRRVVSTNYGAFWVDPVSNLGLTLLERGEYEPDMASVLEALLAPGAVFVDLGANEGYFSVLAARLVGDRGRVVAIEPQGRLGPVIERNLTLNGVSNAALVRAAVTDRPGTAVLYIAPDTNTGATGLDRATRYQVATETVPTLTLAQVFDQSGLRDVDLLKVDIEGFEYEAVLGSPELFRERRVRAVALELHPTILARRGLDADRILAVFRDAGYEVDARFHNCVLRAPE